MNDFQTSTGRQRYYQFTEKDLVDYLTELDQIRNPYIYNTTTYTYNWATQSIYTREFLKDNKKNIFKKLHFV